MKGSLGKRRRRVEPAGPVLPNDGAGRTYSWFRPASGGLEECRGDSLDLTPSLAEVKDVEEDL